MAKIELTIDYGCDCMGCGYGSDDTMSLEISDEVLDALKRLGKEEITAENVVAAIEGGESILAPLHDKIEDAYYHMVEEYWLFEAYNECLEESLAAAIENDIESGEYTPISFEEFVEDLKSGSIDFDGLEFGYFDDIDEDYDFEDEEDLEYKYNSYILNGYYDWVKEHDHAFVAERVGLDLYACREGMAEYTIRIEE